MDRLEEIMKPPGNPKHLKFALEYIQSNDASGSYMKVYPKSTRESAIRRASLLLQDPDVKKFIEDYYLFYASETAKNIISQEDKWVKNMERIANLDLHISPQQTLNANIKLYEWNQQLKAIEAVQKAEAAANALAEQAEKNKESKDD